MDKSECKNHKWIPLLGVDKGKTIPTALFTCLKCGALKVGKQTIKISRFRMDMGGLPIYHLQEMRLMNEPVTDATASGLVAIATVDTNSQGVGAPLFMAADGNLDTADASSDTTSPCIALALEPGTGSKKILLHGILRNDAWNWTTGPGSSSLIYVSTNTGILTQTQPTGTDEVIQPVGWALTDDCIYFSPSLIYLTHT